MPDDRPARHVTPIVPGPRRKPGSSGLLQSPFQHLPFCLLGGGAGVVTPLKPEVWWAAFRSLRPRPVCFLVPRHVVLRGARGGRDTPEQEYGHLPGWPGIRTPCTCCIPGISENLQPLLPGTRYLRRSQGVTGRQCLWGQRSCLMLTLPRLF